MFIEAMIIGLIISFLRGGRMDNLNYLEIKAWYLIIFGMGLQLLPVFISGYTFILYFQMIGIIFVLTVIIMNIKLKGFWLMLIGGMLNFTAVVLNHFKMPVNPVFIENNNFSGFMDTVVDGEIVNYIANSVGGWSAILGKIMMTPSWYPFPRLLSIGDVIISLGIMWFIYGESKNKNLHRKSKMVQYTYKSRI
ncbi:MAG: DUF5317 domain-containing protein [Clostridiales bacterium]|nr:DUF5317 domain-containing protein [Clostridiales bacterium]